MDMNKNNNSKDNLPDDKSGDALDSTGEDSLSGAPSKRVVAAFGELEGSSDGEANKENKDPVAVVSPRKSPTMAAFKALGKRFRTQGRKVKQLLDTISERDTEIANLRETVAGKDEQLESKDTHIDRLKNTSEKIQMKKSAIQEATRASCTASIELYKAKWEAGKLQITDLKKAFKRANRMLDSHERQAIVTKNKVNEANDRNAKLTEENYSLKSDCRDLRKSVCLLKRQNQKLLDDNSDTNLQREQIALERERIKVELAKEARKRVVQEEEAKEARQINVENNKAKLKDQALRKRKADKLRDAAKKQEDNQRKLKAARTMMMNVGDAASIASYHHDMNRSNPDNGMFLNSRQLRQNVDAGMGVSEYDTSMSILAGESRVPRQMTLTQCEREDRLAPPPAPKKPPLPNPRDLPPGVRAQRDVVSGIIYYKSVDNDTGEVYVDTDLDRLMSTKRSPPANTRDSSPIRNITMSQLSDLTQTEHANKNQSHDSTSTDEIEGEPPEDDDVSRAE